MMLMIILTKTMSTHKWLSNFASNVLICPLRCCARLVTKSFVAFAGV